MTESELKGHHRPTSPPLNVFHRAYSVCHEGIVIPVQAGGYASPRVPAWQPKDRAVAFGERESQQKVPTSANLRLRSIAAIIQTVSTCLAWDPDVLVPSFFERCLGGT
jgi:hypothetical protein